MLKLTPQIWKKLNNRAIHKGSVRKYEGSFEVLRKVGNVAYRLKLPDSYKIHPTFHVSFLKVYNADVDDQGRQKAKRAHVVVVHNSTRKLRESLTTAPWVKAIRTGGHIFWFNRRARAKQMLALWQFEDMIADYLRLHTTRTSSSSSGGGLLNP